MTEGVGRENEERIVEQQQEGVAEASLTEDRPGMKLNKRALTLVD